MNGAVRVSSMVWVEGRGSLPLSRVISVGGLESSTKLSNRRYVN